MFDRGHGVELACAAGRTENADAFEDAVFCAARVGREDDFAANGVAGKEGDVESSGDGGLDVAEHFDGPVFIVADGEKAFGAEERGGIGVGIEIRDVGDVVALRLEPERDGKFPKEKFAGALGEWRVEDLAVLAVGTIEADVNIAAPIPFAFAIVVEGELGGPAVVGVPGGVAALESEVGSAIVADDEDDVVLPAWTGTVLLADREEEPRDLAFSRLTSEPGAEVLVGVLEGVRRSRLGELTAGGLGDRAQRRGVRGDGDGARPSPARGSRRTARARSRRRVSRARP